MKASEPKQTRIPKTQLAGAGEGCALARAPVRSAISWALLRPSGRYRLAPPRPLPTNRSAPDRAAGPGNLGGEGRMLHPGLRRSQRGEPAAASFPSALRARSGSPAGPGRRKLRPSWDSSRWEAPRPGFCGCLIAAWPLGKASYPFPSPTLPFFCPPWRLCHACIPRGLRGACVRAKRWQRWRLPPQPGRLFLSPSLPPKSPHVPHNPRGTSGARRSREFSGERDRDRRAEPSWI